MTGAASDQSRYEAGVKRFREVTGGEGLELLDSFRDLAPDLSRYMAEFGYADIYSRPGLELRERQVATLAALTTLGAAEPQLGIHVRAALKIGLSRDEVVEVVLHCLPFAGFVRVINAMGVVREVFAEPHLEVDTRGSGS